MNCDDNNVSSNFTLIDPNCEILSTQPWFSTISNNDISDDFRNRGIPKFEEIRSFVEFSMIPKNPNYVLIQGNTKTVNSQKQNGPIILQGFKQRGSDRFYSTDYTDELMGGDETNYEGFGIKNVEVTFDANKVPQVSVTFYDLRGNVLNNFNSKFAKMFQLPYPIFNLKIKGGFGPTVEYRLLKTRDDISVDEFGNYVINSKFIGDRFAPLSDVPLLYLMSVPYLDGKSVDILDTNINSFHELIVSSKRLFEKVEQVKNSDQVIEQENQVKKLTELINQLEAIQNQLNDVNTFKNKFLESNEVKNGLVITDSSGNKVGSLKDLFTDLANNFIIVDKDKSVNFGVPGLNDNTDGQFFTAFNRIVIESVNLYNKQISDIDPTVSNLITTSNALYTRSFINTQRLERINFKDLVDRIGQEKLKLQTIASDAATKLSTQLVNLPPTYLGKTDLTIGSIFSIISKDYNILLDRIKKAGDDGYTQIKNGQRTQQKFDRMGFPTVIDKDRSGANKLIYPGVKPEFANWPEVKLVEDFITAYAKAAKASALADLLSETNNDGVSKYAPINPREVYQIDDTGTSANQVSPDNIYFSKGLSELCKLIYERFLILTNVNLNMISTPSSDYGSWDINPDEGGGVALWVKECFFNKKDINEIKKGAFNFAISLEARNIAFAISTNSAIKTYFQGLEANFNSSFFTSHPTDEIVKAIKDTDVSSNKLALTQVGAFDDDYVTAGVAAPQLQSQGSPATDILGQFLSSISPDTQKPFSFTKKNVIFIPDAKKGSTRQAVMPAKTVGDILSKSVAKSLPVGSNLTVQLGIKTFELIVGAAEAVTNLLVDGTPTNLSNINNDIIPSKTVVLEASDYDSDTTRLLPWYARVGNSYRSLKEQIEETNTIYELYNYTNGDISNKSVFDFDLLNQRLTFPALVEIPRGMLIIMGSVLKSKVDSNQIKSGGYYELELSGENYNVKKDSKFYKLLLYEAETFNDDYGWKNEYKNGTYFNVRVFDPTTKQYKQTLEATLKYLYTPAYIAVNDYRFNIDKGTSFNTVISKGPADNGLYNKYLTSLLKKIAEFVKKDQEELDAKLRGIDSHIKDPDVKLATYKSFQVIYENFLHGVNNDSYKLKVTDGDDSSFKFVDRAYNPIGNICILDLKTLLNDVNDTDVSLLSAISRLLSDNNFWFYPFQGWLTDKENYKELFRIQYDDPRKTKPVFVAMYVGGLSSNPGNTGNLDDFPLKDDSIKKGDIPEDFRSNGGNLNAFKVKFTGSQNQMVFSNLQVSTESLKNTDEGLRIQSDIINNASNSFSIPKGQSLLNVYQKQSYTSTVKIPFGNMGIQPTQYYYQEYMPLFDGLYIIYSVSHAIDSDTQRLETTFKGYRLKRDVNPIVEQYFVDFINNNFFTDTLRTAGLSFGNASCGKATPNTVDVVYPKSVKWAGGKEPVRVPITNPPTYKINLSNQPQVPFVRTIFTSQQVIQAAEIVVDKISPSATPANKKRIITSVLAITIKEQSLRGFNNNLSGVEASGFAVFGASDVNGKVQATEGGTGKIKFYYSFTNLATGLVPSTSNIISRNMFPQNDEPNEFAWRWFRDWNGYGGRTTPEYKSGKRTDCDIIAGAEKVYIQAMKEVNKYSKYASATSLVIPSVSTNTNTGSGSPTATGGSGSGSKSSASTPAPKSVEISTTATILTIGDSLSNNLSQFNRNIPKITSPIALTQGGERTPWLLGQLKAVKTPLTSVKKVILSMGANDNFVVKQDQTDLINEISRVFPSAQKFILNGHYGWGGNAVTATKTDAFWTGRINQYMNLFKGKGYTVVGDLLGPIQHPTGSRSDKFFQAVGRDLKTYGIT
jgi:hypothetical protein